MITWENIHFVALQCPDQSYHYDMKNASSYNWKNINNLKKAPNDRNLWVQLMEILINSLTPNKFV